MHILGYFSKKTYLCTSDSDNVYTFLHHLMFYVCKDNKKVWIK